MRPVEAFFEADPRPLARRGHCLERQAILGKAKGQNEGKASGELARLRRGDPQVDAEVLVPPRRERFVLKNFVSNRACGVTKAQMCNYVYGHFSEDIDANVIKATPASCARGGAVASASTHRSSASSLRRWP